jgi:hypothetical protein
VEPIAGVVVGGANMTPYTENAPRAPVNRVLPFWAIWFALVAAIPIYAVFLGGELVLGRNTAGASLPPVFFLALFQIIAATAVRWLVLPRFVELPKKLVWMIVGLALSNGASFHSIFLFPRNQPETKLLTIVLAFLSVLQFAPFYAREPRRSAFR